MNLLNHFRLAVRTWLDEVFIEEPYLPEAAQHDKVATLLTEAQAALNLLRANLSEATARNQRTQADWVRALAQVQALEMALDDDRRAGLHQAVQVKQRQLATLKQRVSLLKGALEYGQTVARRLQVAVDGLQFRLDETRWNRAALATRNQMVEVLMGLDRLDRELTRDEVLLNDRLPAEEAALQKKEDWLAAREEWKRK
jgi:hypothetical protein